MSFNSLALNDDEVFAFDEGSPEYFAYASGKGNAGASGKGKKGVSIKKKSDTKKKSSGKSKSGASGKGKGGSDGSKKKSSKKVSSKGKGSGGSGASGKGKGGSDGSKKGGITPTRKKGKPDQPSSGGNKPKLKSRFDNSNRPIRGRDTSKNRPSGGGGGLKSRFDNSNRPIRRSEGITPARRGITPARQGITAAPKARSTGGAWPRPTGYGQAGTGGGVTIPVGTQRTPTGGLQFVSRFQGAPTNFKTATNRADKWRLANPQGIHPAYPQRALGNTTPMTPHEWRTRYPRGIQPTTPPQRKEIYRINRPEPMDGYALGHEPPYFDRGRFAGNMPTGPAPTYMTPPGALKQITYQPKLLVNVQRPPSTQDIGKIFGAMAPRQQAGPIKQAVQKLIGKPAAPTDPFSRGVLGLPPASKPIRTDIIGLPEGDAFSQGIRQAPRRAQDVAGGPVRASDPFSRGVLGLPSNKPVQPTRLTPSQPISDAFGRGVRQVAPKPGAAQGGVIKIDNKPFTVPGIQDVANIGVDPALDYQWCSSGVCGGGCGGPSMSCKEDMRGMSGGEVNTQEIELLKGDASANDVYTLNVDLPAQLPPSDQGGFKIGGNDHSGSNAVNDHIVHLGMGQAFEFASEPEHGNDLQHAPDKVTTDPDMKKRMSEGLLSKPNTTNAIKVVRKKEGDKILMDVYAKDSVPRGETPKGDWKYVGSKTFNSNDKVAGKYGFTTRIDEQPDGNPIKIGGIKYEKLDSNYKSPIEGLGLPGHLDGGGGGGDDEEDEDSDFAQAYYSQAKWTTPYRHSIIAAPSNAGYW